MDKRERIIQKFENFSSVIDGSDGGGGGGGGGGDHGDGLFGYSLLHRDRSLHIERAWSADVNLQ